MTILYKKLTSEKRNDMRLIEGNLHENNKTDQTFFFFLTKALAK